MTDEQLQQYVELNPNVMAGKPVIRGTRIPVELVIRLLAQGKSESEVLQQYPRLQPEDIRAALGRDPDDTVEPLYPVDHIVIDAQANHIGGAKMFRWDQRQRAFVQVDAYDGEPSSAA